MKKSVGVVLLVIFVSLAPNLKVKAIASDSLKAPEETEESRTDKLICGIVTSLMKSIDAEAGGCWRRTIHPLKMSRYDKITYVFKEISEHFEWEMEAEILDEENFQIVLKNNNYLIKKGDTLSEIAKEYNTSVEKLLELNSNIVDANQIYYDTYLKMGDDWQK